MPANITIRVDGEKLVISKLEATRRATGVKTMARIGSYLIQAAGDRTDKGRDIHGKKIKVSKRAKAQSGTTLRDTGLMHGAYKIREVRQGFVEVGFADRAQGDKAFWHQYGTPPYTIKPGEGKILSWKGFGKKGKWNYSTVVNHPGLPARPVFGFGRGDERKIRGIFRRAVEDVVKGVNR